MALIPESKNLIDQNETKYKSSVSEATFTRIGASINYIINRILASETFEWSGIYSQEYDSDLYGVGGMRFIYKDTEISYYTMTNHIGGTSGVTSVNFEVYDETNALLGDLFSTEPSISSSTGNRAVIGYDVETSTAILAGAGKNTGILNYTQLLAGWRLVPRMVSSQDRGENLFFKLALKEL